MKKALKNNLLSFLYIGETSKDYQQIEQIISEDLLPISTQLQTNLSKALFDLDRLNLRKIPQVILLNADLSSKVVLEFLQHYQKHIYNKFPTTLFYICSTEQQPLSTWKENFPFLSDFIHKPYHRESFEQIASRLLQQFLPPMDLTIDLSA